MRRAPNKCGWLKLGRKESCGKRCYGAYCGQHGGLSEAIQNLPPELREIILKEYIAIKIKEKKEMGWDDVHYEINEAPFCKKRSRIVKVMFCSKCSQTLAAKKDSVTSVIKTEKNIISATPCMTRTTTPKSLRNFTERRDINLGSKQKFCFEIDELRHIFHRSLEPNIPPRPLAEQ